MVAVVVGALGAAMLAPISQEGIVPLSQILGLPFGPSYQVVSWLCWVPNLLIVEMFVVHRPRVIPIEVATP